MFWKKIQTITNSELALANAKLPGDEPGTFPPEVDKTTWYTMFTTLANRSEGENGEFAFLQGHDLASQDWVYCKPSPLSYAIRLTIMISTYICT